MAVGKVGKTYVGGRVFFDRRRKKSATASFEKLENGVDYAAFAARKRERVFVERNGKAVVSCFVAREPDFARVAADFSAREFFDVLA